MIRRARERDIDALYTVIGEAFARADESDFMRRLWNDDDLALVLIAEEESAVVGGVAFARASIRGKQRLYNVAWLSPLAVAPAWQRRGLGNALVREGLTQCRQIGFDHVVVLGSYPYYSRFGFSREAAGELTSPRAGDNLLALSFEAGREHELAGTLVEPVAFRAVSVAR